MPDSTRLYGAEPLTIVQGEAGHPPTYVYKDQPAPDGISTADRDRLVDAGYLEEREVMGSPVGASETAYLVVTGPTYNSDGGVDAGTNFNFVADPRHGDLPSWVSVVDGDIVLGDEAGTCAFAMIAAFTFDFSDASGIPDGPDGFISTAWTVELDNINVVTHSESGPESTVGDGETIQSTPAARVGGLIVGTNLSVINVAPYAALDGETSIDDAAVTPNVAMTITRIAQAPILPD
jgi:hypothetical protein